MHLELFHAGRIRRLVKHSTVQSALKRGDITEAEARLKPWYLRLEIDGRDKSFALPASNRDALAAARDILNGRTSSPATFSAFVSAQAAKRGLTVGALADDWLALNCPKTANKPRTPQAAAQIAATLKRALDWWRPQRAADITPQLHNSYALHRMNSIQGTGRTGRRSVDIELAALSCLFQWAVTAGRVERNPFEVREQFVIRDEIEHCHAKTPANDQELARILGWFFTPIPNLPSPSSDRVVAGAALAFGALTGLRPGEVHQILDVPALQQFPADPARLAPGTIYPLPDGTRKLRVARLKHGQNPAVLVTPALADFLDHWHPPAGEAVPAPLFPVRQDRVAELLDQACRELDLPHYTPHGMRAYYVKVRRSQGADDATIAVELGQRSNGDLIRSVYGDPQETVGGNLHDWLPADAQGHPLPAPWAQLTSNVITLAQS
jgi:integrase